MGDYTIERLVGSSTPSPCEHSPSPVSQEDNKFLKTNAQTFNGQQKPAVTQPGKLY